MPAAVNGVLTAVPSGTGACPSGSSMNTSDRDVSVQISEVDLKGRNRNMSAFLKMSHFLSSARSLDELLSGALTKVLTFFECEAGRIYLKDEHRPFLYLAAHMGMEAEGLEQVHVNEGFTGRSYRTRSFIAKSPVELEDKRRAALLLAKGFRTIFCVPLIFVDRVGGVMNLATSKTMRLDQPQIDLLTAMGNQIAVAANHMRLYEDMNRKIQALRKKKEMIKFFAFSVSHDLKSPAVGIHGLARRFKDLYSDALDERGRAYCDQILKSAEHMVALVEKINAFIKARESAMNMDRVDMQEILSSVRDEASEGLEQRNIQWVQPDHLPEIVADRMSLLRLFRNLVDNSLKYGGEDLSEIRIEYAGTGSDHVFRFSDNGEGIPEAAREKIFDLFHRSTSSSGIEGAGLGLAIVKEIVERHGGDVSVESREGPGVTFRITLAKSISDGD
jgi:signal transduction histidine kinase